MTQSNLSKFIQPKLLAKRILLGAGIAIIAILYFIIGAQEQPEWGKYWRIQPLILTPMAGAAGGVFIYLMDILRIHGWNKVLTTGLSIIVYAFVLWIGIVLGLHGTMWN